MKAGSVDVRVGVLLCLMAGGILSGCQTQPHAGQPSSAIGGNEPPGRIHKQPDTSNERLERIEAWLTAYRNRPPMLRAFVQRMPKGGDIHTHLSGAVYAESYLEWAAENDFCVDTQALLLLPPPCTRDRTDQNLPAAELLGNSDLRDRFIDKLSTRNLSYGGKSGHSQFFQAFGGFDPVSSTLERGEHMLAEVTNRAASQRIGYLEVMVTFEGAAVRQLGARRPWKVGSDPGNRRDWLLDNGLADLVKKARADLDWVARRYRDLMKCDSPSPQPGCDVTVRLIAQSTRTKPREQVFAQLLFAFELASQEPLVVGMNLVAPEDHPIALRDYSLHMQMIEFLRGHYPDVKIALHAGELTLGLVHPRSLRFHITQAVEIAGAHRIGHGVSIMYEDQPFELLRLMKERDVAVEICLTSNEVILGVTGDDHPFLEYWRSEVPLTLASDDEGVSRIDLSNEYLRAVLAYDLGYADLKRLSRNSLEYSFLSGASLWKETHPFIVTDVCAGRQAGSNESRACRRFLESNEKARAQWRLEKEFVSFERLAWFE